MSRVNWPRAVASGALWTVTYNFFWGVAWFAFMRDAWLDALASIRRPLPLSAEVWFLLVVLTMLMGVAIMAFSASRAPTVMVWKPVLIGSLALWVLMTLGMAGWGLPASIPTRMIALDSAVNLFCVLAAALAGAWSQRAA